MSLPTLEQLLTFFRDHPLPTDVDPEFQDASLQGLSECSQSSTLAYKVVEYSDNPDNILFNPPDQFTKESNFLNLDDAHYRRLLSGSSGLLYMHPVGKEGSGGKITAKLDLCRKGPEVFMTDTVVPVLTDDDILKNGPRQPNLLEPLAGLKLTKTEIINLVRGSNLLDSSQFAVSQDVPGLFFLARSPGLTNGLANWLENDANAAKLFPDADRRRQIAQAIGGNALTSDDDILRNAPRQPNLLDQLVGVKLSKAEIVNLVRGSGMIDASQFAVSQDSSGVFFLAHNLTLTNGVAGWLEKDPKAAKLFPDAQRRQEIAAAIRANTAAEAKQKEALEQQTNIPPWLLTLGGVLGGTLATIPIMVWMQRRNEKLMKEMQEGPKVDASRMFTDPTDSMRTKNKIEVPKSQERYVEAVRSRFNQGQFPHVVISGPSGSGKSYTADLIGKLAVNGQLGVEGFEKQQVRFVRIDANDIIREAGAWQNGAQTRFFEVLNQLTKETKGPIIIHLLEADKFAAAGQGPGNQPLNLLKELYTIMEGVNPQYRNVHFILDSTRWQTIQGAAPDMLRRAQFMEIIPPVPEDVRKALEIGIDNRRLKHKDDRIRQRFERVSFSSEALDAITALGEYRDGAPPSSHLSLIDQLAEEASKHTSGKITITRDNVLRLVARDKAQPVSQVKTELDRRLGKEGVTQNPRIQEAIMEGFYRAYPEPMKGTVNPMDLAAVANANPASIFSAQDAIELMGTGEYEALKQIAPDALKTNVNAPTRTTGPVLRDTDAIPVDEIDKDVVRRQVALRYPEYLSQTVREALQDGKPLPEGAALISGGKNSPEWREVEGIVNRIVSKYHQQMDFDRSDLDKRWEKQIKDKGYVTNKGVPDSFLTEKAGEYMDALSAGPGTVYNGGADTFRKDAKREVNVSEFERGMELFEHIGR